jgi:hypothetical protein
MMRVYYFLLGASNCLLTQEYLRAMLRALNVEPTALNVMKDLPSDKGPI